MQPANPVITFGLTLRVSSAAKAKLLSGWRSLFAAGQRGLGSSCGNARGFLFMETMPAGTCWDVPVLNCPWRGDAGKYNTCLQQEPVLNKYFALSITTASSKDACGTVEDRINLWLPYDADIRIAVTVTPYMKMVLATWPGAGHVYAERHHCNTPNNMLSLLQQVRTGKLSTADLAVTLLHGNSGFWQQAQKLTFACIT
eukprot:jgi/Chrzof1/10455/UNPLg00382.t1